jgi:Ferritin-like
MSIGTTGNTLSEKRTPSFLAKKLNHERPAGLTWPSFLVQLLHIASSVEHALMVQYLFAAYSLDPTQGKDGTEQQKIANWKNLILSVAKEEMGHLLTVQNVLCLLGGPVELVRDDFPWDSDIQPFDFHLRRLTTESLALYVAAEAPEHQPGAMRLTERLVRETKGAVDPIDLKARAHRVGDLYADIITILQDHKLVPDSVFHHDSIRFQASWDDWGRGHVYKAARRVAARNETVKQIVKNGKTLLESWWGPLTTSKFWQTLFEGWARWQNDPTRADVIIERVATRYQAVHALKLLADQGESAQWPQSSHFQRFSLIASEFMAAKENHKADKSVWEPTYPVADDPYTPLQNAKWRTSGSEITSDHAVKWAHLFNLRYQMLLTYLRHTFQLAREGNEAPLRGVVIHKVFAEMYNLKVIAGILVGLPLGSAPDKHAGPPFQMPYTLALPISAVDRWRLHRELIAGAEELIRDLIQTASSDTALPYLRALASLDKSSTVWIGQIIAGLTQRASTS